MITVYFPKYIQSLTDGVAKQDFDVTTFSSLLDGLRQLFPELAKHMTLIVSQQTQNLVYFIDRDTKKTLTNSLSGKISSSNLVLIITLYGQGDNFGSIAIGAALIAASFIPGLQGVALGAATLSGFMLSSGISLVLSGVLNALTTRPTSSPQSAPDAPMRLNNDAFDGLVNTTTTDTPIPLIYGQHRVSGQFISGKIKTINHGRGEYISVANFI
jgi:predicted phage tail protein